MTDEFIKKVIVSLLVAIAFTLIGWGAPMLYSTYAPEDQFIEVHNFEAQDAPPSSEHHYICFDRTVHEPSSATVYTELYLITDDGKRIEVGGETMKRYFEKGRQRVVTRLSLPEDLESGEYRYALIVQLELSDGRIQRDFQFHSSKFNVTPNADTPKSSAIKC